MQINMENAERLPIPKDTCPIPIMIERNKKEPENTAFILHKSVMAQIILGKAKKTTRTTEHGVTVYWSSTVSDILVVERKEDDPYWYLLSELSYKGSNLNALWTEQDIPNYKIIKVEMEE